VLFSTCKDTKNNQYLQEKYDFIVVESILLFVADAFFASKKISFTGVNDALHKVKTLSAQGRSASLSSLRLGAKHLTSLHKTPYALAQNRITCKSMAFYNKEAIA
jgi:hypothetical protein